jgi:hypothetical protein
LSCCKTIRAEAPLLCPGAAGGIWTDSRAIGIKYNHNGNLVLVMSKVWEDEEWIFVFKLSHRMAMVQKSSAAAYGPRLPRSLFLSPQRA